MIYCCMVLNGKKRIRQGWLAGWLRLKLRRLFVAAAVAVEMLAFTGWTQHKHFCFVIWVYFNCSRAVKCLRVLYTSLDSLLSVCGVIFLTSRLYRLAVISKNDSQRGDVLKDYVVVSCHVLLMLASWRFLLVILRFSFFLHSTFQHLWVYLPYNYSPFYITVQPSLQNQFNQIKLNLGP